MRTRRGTSRSYPLVDLAGRGVVAEPEARIARGVRIPPGAVEAVDVPATFVERAVRGDVPERVALRHELFASRAQDFRVHLLECSDELVETERRDGHRARVGDVSAEASGARDAGDGLVARLHRDIHR